MIWTFNNAHIFLQITIQQINFLKYNISYLQDSVGCDTMCLTHMYQHFGRICCYPPPSLMELGEDGVIMFEDIQSIPEVYEQYSPSHFICIHMICG
jgi:hypothetical protein